jgi:hypothetical protein
VRVADDDMPSCVYAFRIKNYWFLELSLPQELFSPTHFHCQFYWNDYWCDNIYHHRFVIKQELKVIFIVSTREKLVVKILLIFIAWLGLTDGEKSKWFTASASLPNCHVYCGSLEWMTTGPMRPRGWLINGGHRSGVPYSHSHKPHSTLSPSHKGSLHLSLLPTIHMH